MMGIFRFFKRSVLLASAVALLLSCGSGAPGSSNPEPATPKIVLGYYTGIANSCDPLASHPEYLNLVSADIFNVTSSGSIDGSNDSAMLAFNKANGIHTYACISNYGVSEFDPVLGHSAIATNKTKVIANLVALVKNGPYDGINIDFEAIPPADRDLFSQFIQELATALHADGFKLIISVPAKSSDDLDNSWSWPFDYLTLGKHADLLQLMTYDQHGSWGEPGPVSGSDWVESCLVYSASVVAPAKLLIGLPAYGYDWNLADSSQNTSFSWKNTQALLAKTGATPQWDTTTQSPYINYTDISGHPHQAWFENTQSISAKVGLVEKHGLAGLSMWSLGQEDPSFWQAAMSAKVASRSRSTRKLQLEPRMTQISAARLREWKSSMGQSCSARILQLKR